MRSGGTVDRKRYYTLPELLVEYTHLHWYTVISIIAIVLFSGLVVTALIEETPIRQLGWDFWRVGLQGPAIIIYILAIYPILTKMGDNAIESIMPWVDMSKEELDELDSKYRVPNRLGELLSLSAGVIFIIVLSQPWRATYEFNTIFTDIFLYIIEIILFGLLGLLIYYGFHNSRYLTRINKKLKLDIFSVDALAPIARWSLSISLAFMGGIIISIIFQTIDNLRQWQIILIYIILVISTVAIFFISLWSTHVTIAKVKRRELAFVHNKLAQACRKLMQNAGENNRVDVSSNTFHYEVAAWALYERLIRETKEWPYNAGIIGRLVLSIVSPGVVYIIRVFSGSLPGF